MNRFLHLWLRAVVIAIPFALIAPAVQAAATGAGELEEKSIPLQKNSWPNPSFTPSMQNWIEILKKIAALDVDKYLGGHGDVGTKQDVLAEAQMLADFDAGMRAAVQKGMSHEDIIKNVRFEKYKDVRNYYRMNLFITSYYQFLTTGKPENAYP